MAKLISMRPAADPVKRSTSLVAARIIWGGLFGLLLAVVAARLFTGRGLQLVAEQYLVGLSLPAVSRVSPEGFYQYLIIVRHLALAFSWLVALVIYRRRPHDWMALAVSTILLLVAYSQILGGSETAWETLLTFGGLVVFLLVLFLFPNGRFIPQTQRYRLLLAASFAITPFLSFWLLSTYLVGYAPEDYAYGALLITLGVVMFGGVGSQLYRFRFTADSIQRQQTRWVLLGLSLQLLWITWAVAYGLDLLEVTRLSRSEQALLLLQINIYVPLVMPVAFAVAIFWHGLWEMAPLVNRALVYGTLSLVVVILYVLIVGALGILFQTQGSLLISLVATGVVALVFQPLRERLQDIVNRLAYGERDDPVGLLTRVAAQLDLAETTENLLPELADVIAAALKLPHVSIWLVDGSNELQQQATAAGVRPDELERLPLVYRREEIGSLVVAPRSPGERLPLADISLLKMIAQLLAATIHALQLNEQLQLSREQLVRAREEERRRIRRDLHDGLGPALASLTLQADTAIGLVSSDPEEAVRLLQRIINKSQKSVGEIRRLVYDMRPPALDELGLTGAIDQYIAGLAATGISFRSETSIGRTSLPAAVEVAAYRIIQEAVNNVVNHARASSCVIRLAVDGVLSLEIEDDGLGLAPNHSRGIGLQSMWERAVELGGICRIEAAAGRGTRVVARLPLSGRLL